jgi:eukaryotic-like serine/threonine-protein kinase
MDKKSLDIFAKKHQLGDAARSDLMRLVGIDEPNEHVHGPMETLDFYVDLNQSDLYSAKTLHAEHEIITESENVELLPKIPMNQSHRYTDFGLIASGGMGEIRSIYDKVLKRTLAMKIIHRHLIARASAVSRFIEEAQVGAQLQHSNIVPVHALGCLDDGRYFFTMKSIQGIELKEVIVKVHSSIEMGRWKTTDEGWTFRTIIESIHYACIAVEYAHSQGVIHRDLKPENILLENHGEVLVADWGIAKVKGMADYTEVDGVREKVQTNRANAGVFATRMGQVAGTPSYMAPEQARGEVDLIDTRTDIYGMGSILFEALVGRPLYDGGSGEEILQKVLAGKDTSISEALGSAPRGSRPNLPTEIVQVCEKALKRDPNKRFHSMQELATILKEWLDGSRRHSKGLSLVGEAIGMDPEKCRAMARVLRTEAKDHLGALAMLASEEEKSKGWALEDAAVKEEEKAEAIALQRETALQAALLHKEDLTEAHLQLALDYRIKHKEAELIGDAKLVRQLEHKLSYHIEALPIQLPEREAFLDYLKGEGLLSLDTHPGFASVKLYEYELRNRRLIATEKRSLGMSPIRRYDLAMGNYLLKIEKEGFHTTSYPMSIRRQSIWNCTKRGEMTPTPVRLLPLGELEADDCYVPAGYFHAGGDESPCLPNGVVWVEGFVCKQFPVTNADYLEFLNDLFRKGRQDLALEHVPRERSAKQGQAGPMIYGLNEGGFHLTKDGDGVKWQSKWPVCMVTWGNAMAYAEWFSALTGKSWRLPMELEWEKAARGVDGRVFVWGSQFDPTWASMKQSQSIHGPSSIHSYPVDESCYGVRGMGGNIRDWTLDPYVPEPVLPTGVVKMDALRLKESELSRVCRGGSWLSIDRGLQVTRRDGMKPSFRYSGLGFRLVRSI